MINATKGVIASLADDFGSEPESRRAAGNVGFRTPVVGVCP